MKDKDLVYLVALDAREWAEKIQKEKPDLYWEGCGGLCAVTSAKIFLDLQQLGIKSKLVMNNNHTFLLVDKHIVDVTATQFRGYIQDKINIVPEEEAYNGNYFWDTVWTFTSLESLLKFQKENGWPEYQQPFNSHLPNV
jgi:hypothetical protein